MPQPTVDQLAERAARFGNLQIRDISPPRDDDNGPRAKRRGHSRGRSRQAWKTDSRWSQWEWDTWEASPQRRIPQPWTGTVEVSIGYGRAPSTDGQRGQKRSAMAQPPPVHVARTEAVVVGPSVAIQLVHKEPDSNAQVIT